MDKLSSADKAKPAKVPTAHGKKAEPVSAEASALRGPGALDGDRLSASVAGALAQPAALGEPQLARIAEKKATCPFIGAAVATKALPVRSSAEKPLASIDDVVALGNSGGGDLGEVLKLFASGNHAKMQGPSGALDTPAPAGLFSLDFPGSQGSHPGHSGILQGDPTQLDSGRLSQADLDRLLSRAENGRIKRSDIAAFIAENLAKDPEAKVFDAKVAGLLLGDFGRTARQSGATLWQKLKGHFQGAEEAGSARKLSEELTKLLGENNLVGSAGEFGLLMAFLANSPRTRTVDGEPAVAVEDLTVMFRDHRFPEGWEDWPKTKLDWVTNTTALLLEAGKAYHGQPRA